jgi:hypothetical protein
MNGGRVGGAVRVGRVAGRWSPSRRGATALRGTVELRGVAKIACDVRDRTLVHGGAGEAIAQRAIRGAVRLTLWAGSATVFSH